MNTPRRSSQPPRTPESFPTDLPCLVPRKITLPFTLLWTGCTILKSSSMLMDRSLRLTSLAPIRELALRLRYGALVGGQAPLSPHWHP